MTGMLLWYGFGASMVAGIAVMLWATKIIHAFLGLMVVLLGVAGVFLLAGAEFLAAAQIMVYIGGVLVLMAFGLMLSDRDSQNEPINQARGQVFSLALCLGMGTVLVIVANRFIATTNLPTAHIDGSRAQVQHLGISLMTTHLVPLELVGILLLVALVGSLVIAGKNAN